MKNIFKRKQQEETEMKTNKFAGKRQYKLRIGLPEKTLTKLTDLYELLQRSRIRCDHIQRNSRAD